MVKEEQKDERLGRKLVWRTDGLNNARRLEIAFGIDEAGSHFSENTKSFEAPTALYSELALEYTNVIKPCGREVNQLALKRQRFRSN